MNLTKIALITSIVGLLILFYLSSKLLPKKTPIEEIENKNIDDWVVVEGIVKDVKNFDKFTLVNICEKTCINVIIFDKIDIQLNEKIRVIGKIKIYKQKKEIYAEKIEYV